MLYLDTSALVARHIDVAGRRSVVDACDADPMWVTSTIALTEAIVLVDRLSNERIVRDDLEDALRRDWDRCHVVPVDQRCLERAAQLARHHLLRLSDAIHLAAADRLPRPLTFLTLDPAHITVALDLGFVVSSPMP